MGEIEKLYENAGIEKIHNCKGCEYEEDYICPDNCPQQQLYYPPFTAEKQLGLIKWLAHKAPNGLLIKKHITNSGASMVFDNLGYESTLASSFISFEECIAKLVNNLWQYLTEEEKELVMETLNRTTCQAKCYKHKLAEAYYNTLREIQGIVAEASDKEDYLLDGEFSDLVDIIFRKVEGLINDTIKN